MARPLTSRPLQPRSPSPRPPRARPPPRLVLAAEEPHTAAGAQPEQADDAQPPASLAALAAIPAGFSRALSLEGAALDALLEAVLEQLGAPAFVLFRGQVTHANANGRALLAGEPLTAQALEAAAQGRAEPASLRRVPLAVPGREGYLLAVLCAPSDDPRPRARAFAQRWGLTPRQQEVLALLARGLANRTIAELLACAERTIEQHLRVIFDKAGVESRAALVARFWTEQH